MNTDLGFELNTEDQDLTGFSPIPAGTYTLCVEHMEIKPTKDGTGRYVNARMKIIGGNSDNRTFFKNFNIVNKSTVAEKIGRDELARLLDACGFDKLNDLSPMIGQQFKGTLKINPPKGGYDASNDISKYEPLIAKVKVTGNESPVTAEVEEDTIPF